MPAVARARRRPVVTAAALVLVAALTACGSLPGATRGSEDSAAAPLSTDYGVDGVATEQAPVYWLGRGEQSGYLFREFRTPSGNDMTDPVAQAVSLMTSVAPLDGNYTSRWSAARTVGTSVSRDGTITVDMPAEAFATRLEEHEAHEALQQLVYTATAAAVTAGLVDPSASKRVKILVDGRSGYEAFGSVTLDDPLTRDEAMAAPMWLIDPQSTVTISRDVTLYGRHLGDVKNPTWEILEGDEVVEHGTIKGERPTQGTASAVEFRQKVRLDPGSYTARVSGTDRKGHEVVDDHSFKVTED